MYGRHSSAAASTATVVATMVLARVYNSNNIVQGDTPNTFGPSTFFPQYGIRSNADF